MNIFASIGDAQAQGAIEAIRTELRKRRKAGVIAVADSHGELLGLLRLDGAPLSSIQIAANKAWTAARERKPTHDIGKKVRDPEKGFDIAYYGDPRIVGWGGGIPVLWKGVVVGAVGVSGLSQVEDIELAQLGVNAILAMNIL